MFSDQLRKSADWRRNCALKYPSQQRDNLRSADALDALANLFDSSWNVLDWDRAILNDVAGELHNPRKPGRLGPKLQKLISRHGFDRDVRGERDQLLCLHGMALTARNEDHGAGR